MNCCTLGSSVTSTLTKCVLGPGCGYCRATGGVIDVADHDLGAFRDELARGFLADIVDAAGDDDRFLPNRPAMVHSTY